VTAIVRTARLRLREFRAADLDELAAMVGDEEHMRFYPRPKTRDEARAWIGRNLALYREHGFGFWRVEPAESSDFLGYCGIRPLQVDGVAEVEIGWHTKRTSWNRGIATEAATAARDVAFSRFGLDRLVALIHPTHGASRRVAKKVGMEVEGETVLDDDYPALIYAVAAVSRSGRASSAARRGATP
jgi:RimJ/RimL family protein N-acetyltransferase